MENKIVENKIGGLELPPQPEKLQQPVKVNSNPSVKELAVESESKQLIPQKMEVNLHSQTEAATNETSKVEPNLQTTNDINSDSQPSVLENDLFGPEI